MSDHQAELMTCKSGAPTLDGGRSSHTVVNISVTSNKKIDA